MAIKEEEASVKTLDPFIPPAVVEVRDPEVIIISSDDSSSEDSSSEYTSSPAPVEVGDPAPVEVGNPAPVEAGDPEAIIISSDDSSSEAPSPEAYDENLRYVAEAIQRERGYKYLTVAIDRMLAVMTPIGGGIEPRLVGVENNRCYCVEMTIDTNYRVFPRDIPEVPDLHVNHHEITIYLPPGVDSVNLSDAAQGYPDDIENLPEEDPENPVYYFNFFELVYLEKYIHPNNLEGSNNLERSNNIEPSSFSFSEPIEDKEVVNSPNISLNNYNNERSPFNSVEIESRISSSASQAREVNMFEGSNSGEAVHSSYSDKRGSFGPPGRTDNFSSSESEVSLISADDISRDYISRDGAPSPQFFIPESSPPSIPIDSYNPRDSQEVGDTLGPNLLNREEEALPAPEIDANLAREVLMNASLGNQTVVETIDPSELIPILPISPMPVEAEDSPLSSIGDEEL